MVRFQQVRASVQRAYQAGRDSVRAARAPAEPAPHDEGGGEHFQPVLPDAEPPPAPVPVHPSTTSRDDADVPYSLRISAAWSWRLLVLAIAVYGVVRVVGILRFVMIPLAIALLLTAFLSPAVGWLLRARFHRTFAVVVVMICGLAAVAGTLTLVVNEFVSGAPQLSNDAAKGVRQIQDWLRTGPLHLSDAQLNRFIDEAQSWITDNSSRFTSGALATAATVAEVLTGAVLVLFSTFFFLRDGRKIWRFIVRLFPLGGRWRIDDAGQASWSALGNYVRATVLVAFIDALGIGIVLVICRIPFSFALAALVFLGAFIPIVGATLSGAVAVLVALVAQGPIVALIILGAVIGVQQLEGHVLQPLIMGRAVALHPLAIIVSIASGVIIAGIVGALVAVPLIAVLNTAVRRLNKRRPPSIPPGVEVVSTRQ
ncbi:MAG TPA: AI-2E family transporter [Asanoa sp.]|nr:AI-2E family transporter [Asanoa sp.]